MCSECCSVFGGASQLGAGYAQSIGASAMEEMQDMYEPKIAESTSKHGSSFWVRFNFS